MVITIINNALFRSTNNTFNCITLKTEQSTLYYRGDDDGFPRGTTADYVIKAIFLEDPETIRKSGRVKFLWADETGSRYPNGSWSGALGMFADSKGDGFIKPMDFYTVPGEIVDPGSVFCSFNYIVMHVVNEKEVIAQSLMALANLLVPSFELLKTAVYGILGYRIFFFSFLFVLWKFFKKPKSNLQIKILAFFYLLYWFFVGEFYNCSISTESITVDSSDLLYSESQILNTKKTPCFPEDGIELEIFRGAPNNSLARKIYEKRTRPKTCLMYEKTTTLDYLDQKERSKLPRVYGLIPDLANGMGAKVMHAASGKSTYTNMSPIIGSLRTMVVRKSFRKDARRFWDYAVNLYFQFGIVERAISGYEEFSRYALPKAKEGYRNYQSLSEFGRSF